MNTSKIDKQLLHISIQGKNYSIVQADNTKKPKFTIMTQVKSKVYHNYYLKMI
jgi:hypothetical protein